MLLTAGSSADDIVDMVQSLAPDGIDHIVEVAFNANVETNERLLRQGGSIATYATGKQTLTIPFWPFVFKNISVHFPGSDDFPMAAKTAAAAALNGALEAGWC